MRETVSTQQHQVSQPVGANRIEGSTLAAPPGLAVPWTDYALSQPAAESALPATKPASPANEKFANEVLSVLIEKIKERSHPKANIYPMLAEDELYQLAADIEVHGLNDPIIRNEGMILDGRNREVACRLAGKEPRYAEFKDLSEAQSTNPEAFIFSCNLMRRNLNTSQRAMLGVKWMAIYAKAAMVRKKAALNGGLSGDEPKGQSRDLAGKVSSVSGRSMQYAKQVEEAGVPELSAVVIAGKLSVSAAAMLSKLPKEEQARLIKQGPKALKEKAKKERAKKFPRMPSVPARGNHPPSRKQPIPPSEIVACGDGFKWEVTEESWWDQILTQMDKRGAFWEYLKKGIKIKGVEAKR